jgi:hypothetical protein
MYRITKQKSTIRIQTIIFDPLYFCLPPVSHTITIRRTNSQTWAVFGLTVEKAVKVCFFAQFPPYSPKRSFWKGPAACTRLAGPPPRGSTTTYGGRVKGTGAGGKSLVKPGTRVRKKSKKTTKGTKGTKEENINHGRHGRIHEGARRKKSPKKPQRTRRARRNEEFTRG